MMLDLTINLGQIIEAACFVVSIAVGVMKVSARTEEGFHIIERHETWLQDHEERIRDQGERIAAIAPERRR